MFSGIIKEKGKIMSIRLNFDNGDVCVYIPESSKYAYVGQSISVDGVCLTVKNITKKTACFDFTPETFNKSTLKYMKNGDIVNIEPALSINADISGHFVLGHVDGIGRLFLKKPYKNSYVLGINVIDNGLKKYLINKASIAVNGISLTIADVKDSGFFTSIIPFTYINTNIENKKPGDHFNLEFDIIEKTVLKSVEDILKDLKDRGKIFKEVFQ